MNTALVPAAPCGPDAPPRPASNRPRADFLAQLIATMAQAPQTRVRRRAEPDEAIAAYAASGRRPMPARRALSRSL